MIRGPRGVFSGIKRLLSPILDSPSLLLALDLLGKAAEQVEHRLGDVTDPESLEAALDGVERIYHAAAFVGFEGGSSDEERLFAVNVGGTRHVVDAALRAGITRLVHTSSIAALGRPERPAGVIDETAVWHPSRHNTAYARSKYQAELEVYRGVAEGLDAVVVNPALIFGVGRPGENTMQIVERVRDGRMPALPAGGTCVVDVRDVAAGHLLAMRRGAAGERYLLGGQNLSWKAIIETLADAFGVDAPRIMLRPRVAQGLAVAAEAVAALTRTRPLLTRETARIASRTHRYDNRKAVEDLGVSFRPFAETAAHIARALTMARD